MSNSFPPLLLCYIWIHNSLKFLDKTPDILLFQYDLKEYIQTLCPTVLHLHCCIIFGFLDSYLIEVFNAISKILY